jgi:P4 family phage/plasmid primase-like protien
VNLTATLGPKTPNFNVKALPTNPSTIKPLDIEKADSECEAANYLEQQLPPTKTVGEVWRSYREGVWRETQKDIYRPIAQAIMPIAKRTARRESTLLKHLEGRWQVDPHIFRGTLMWDEDTGDVLINVLNGVLRVTPTTIKKEDHDPKWHFTRCLKVKFEPEATPSLYLKTLSECVEDVDDRELFQHCLGNFLYPDCRYETSLVCYGEAGCGKSTLADVVAAVFGDKEDGFLTRLGMKSLCDPECYALAKLQYACVNLGTELQSIEVDDSGNYKTIVSGEPLEARPIYCPPFTMRTHAKLWFLANNLPRFKNGTSAELRRTKFIRFDKKPAKIDVTLKSRLLEEISGVLNFMLTGLQKLMVAEGMPAGGAHSRSTYERFRISNDPLGTFIKDLCILDPEATVPKDSLEIAFRDFCEQNSLPTNIVNTFFRRLYERHPELTPSRKREGDNRVQAVAGITLIKQSPSQVSA